MQTRTKNGMHHKWIVDLSTSKQLKNMIRKMQSIVGKTLHQNGHWIGYLSYVRVCACVRTTSYRIEKLCMVLCRSMCVRLSVWFNKSLFKHLNKMEIVEMKRKKTTTTTMMNSLENSHLPQRNRAKQLQHKNHVFKPEQWTHTLLHYNGQQK